MVMKDRSLKSLFRISIVSVLVASLLATILTYVVVIILFSMLEFRSIYPANYYEAKLPDIESYIRSKGAALLEAGAREELEQVIPLEGIDYQLLDGQGNPVYGSLTGTIIPNREELYRRLNTVFPFRDKYVRAVPILNERDDHVGTALLAYKLQVSPANGGGRFWIIVLFLLVVVTPFFYLVLFMFLFSKRFAAHVNEPLNMLMEAAHQIKNRNLDFELSYRSNNELGQLCAAFSDMKHELQRSLAAQWRMEDERRNMTEALAHDLKTPLSLILAYSEALMDDAERNASEKTVKYLRIIKENAEKSSALVRQMQYVSDLENSGPDLMPVTVHIASFIRQKVSYYELLAKRKGIRIVTDIQGTSDAPVQFDADKVERILDNIVTNSLEHTPEGGHIRISANVGTDRAAYEIANSGPEFTGKDLEHMFKRFYRGEESRGGKGHHSGLGLYIVKQLTEKLGGSVQAYNSGAGEACITFWHPVAPTAKAHATQN